jgi:hypothetical protein
VGLGRRSLASMAPPAAEGFDRTWGGVVLAPHPDPAVLVRRIVPAIGTNLPPLLIRQIVRLDECWRPLRLRVPPPIGPLAHAGLLVHLDGNDRLSRTLQHLHPALARAQWRIALGRRRPLYRLARAWSARVQLCQERRDGGRAALRPLARQRFGPWACALAGPAPGRQGSPTCRWVHQRCQRGDQRRRMALERVAPAARPPHPPAGRTRQRRLVTPRLTPTTHRPLP